MTGDRYTCTVRPLGAGGEDFAVRAGRAVLLEMVARGVRAIEVGCRGGGCGVCRVEVIEGDYETKRMSKRHVSEDDRAAGFALACRLVAKSDLVVRPAPAGEPAP